MQPAASTRTSRSSSRRSLPSVSRSVVDDDDLLGTEKILPSKGTKL